MAKAKGTIASKLTRDDFLQLYNGHDLVTFRTRSIKNFTKGYVNIIHDDKVILANKKREKVYVNGMWVDTKPLIHHADSITSSCVEGPEEDVASATAEE